MWPLLLIGAGLAWVVLSGAPKEVTLPAGKSRVKGVLETPFEMANADLVKAFAGALPQLQAERIGPRRYRVTYVVTLPQKTVVKNPMPLAGGGSMTVESFEKVA